MRNKVGTFCMLLGAALLFGALSLFIRNQIEASSAGQAADDLLPRLIEEIDRTQGAETVPGDPAIPMELLDAGAFEMTEVEIDGYGYIGYLSIPSLSLELPIMADWDYGRLKIAPCRYTGSVRGEDLVIMAHNYARHFGGLSVLSAGDSVVFTDMNGVITSYTVVGLDILAPTAVEEMTSGDFDLTLFTCTYGGKSRVTVYCDLAADG